MCYNRQEVSFLWKMRTGKLYSKNCLLKKF